MRPPRLGSPFLSLLLLINTALAVVLTNTDYNLQIGTPFTITWSENAAAVTIELYGGDNADSLFSILTIATNVGGNSFTWTPSNIPQRNAYAIVVSDGSTASAISFAFTFAAAATTSSTTAPPTTTSSRATTPTNSILDASTITTVLTLTGSPSNKTTHAPTSTPTSTTPTGPPTHAPTYPAVPGISRGDTNETLSLPAKIGIGLAAGIGVAAILAGSAFMIIKKNKEYDRKKELEDGAISGTGGSTPELGAAGWKAAEKRPEGWRPASRPGSRPGSQGGIELGQQPPRKSFSGSGPPPGVPFGGAAMPPAGAGTPSGRLTPGRPSTPNMPRTPSPLAKEVGVAVGGSPPRR